VADVNAVFFASASRASIASAPGCPANEASPMRQDSISVAV